MRTMMVDPYWYPALNVLAHFEADFANRKVPKKAEEMLAVAIAMAGMQEMHKKEYLIQGVSDSEQSPDVRTMYCESRGEEISPWCYQQDVEVVSYTKYSSNQTLADFVAGTKLAPDNAYDELTTILVNVQTEARLPLANEWRSALLPTGKKNPVLILGKISETKPEFRLAIVHPIIEGVIDYNAVTLLKNQGYTKVKHWSLGSKNIITMKENEKHCPFKKFEVTCQLL